MDKKSPTINTENSIHNSHMTKQKEVVIFIHGAWHGKWCWDKHFRASFSENGYEVVTFDLPGHDVPGKVKGINKYSLGDYVQALQKEVQKFDSLPILIGHSMGGLILQKYLERNTCKKAVFLASAPPYGVINATLRFAKKRYFYPSILSMNLYLLVNSEAKSKDAFFSENISQEALREYTSQMCSESFRAFLNMLFPRVKVTEHANIPTLVIGGKQDYVFSESENVKTAKKFNAKLIMLENMAHDMMLDVNHKSVSDEIIGWLNG